MCDAGAITAIPPDVAKDTRMKSANRSITIRVVLRGKPTDDGPRPKARWCVHGVTDPEIHETERSCPTPQLATLHLAMQVCAPFQYEASVGIATTAIMQGDLPNRMEPRAEYAGRRIHRSVLLPLGSCGRASTPPARAWC